MRLTKIKLAGFKSFVDPTVISFPSNLMGIVGPNGCGKSNIIDAIRWVLGESSAKTLRGDSMADVIFNGSAGRKPVGQASIELVFDNTDGTLSGAYAGYNEVSLRRVVSRDGTSQYFLNNARCRRKDITHILLGTGLGSHGYSIIEQGMISRLVEAKPEELRAFLEEAAGISKYKERRRETGHRIRHTRENLERLADLRDEVDKQLAHLQRQARAAERYKSLKAEQRRVGAELLALRLQELRSDLRSRESQLNEQQVALDAAVASQRGVETTIEKKRVELSERSDEFTVVQGEYYKVGAEIARLEQSIQHRKELGQRQRTDLASTEQHLEEIKAHIESDRTQIQEFERLLNALNPELEEAQRSRRASEEALEQAEAAVEDWRHEWQTVTDGLAEAERLAEVEKTKMLQFSERLERLSREAEKLVEEQASLNLDSAQQQTESLVADEERQRIEVEAANRELQSVWDRIQRLRAEDRRLTEELDRLRKDLQESRGRLVSLEALQQAALGDSSEKIAGWLSEQALQDSPRLAEEVVVAPGWERAVETVLGSYLQAICVDDLGAVADRLKPDMDGDLLLFTPGHEAPERLASSDDFLSAHVSGPAVDLLAGVRVAESLDVALAMRAQLESGESVVTRDGIWLGPNWLRINRRDDPRSGVLTRAEEIKDLELVVAAAGDRLATTETALQRCRHELAGLEDAHTSAQATFTEAQERYALTKGSLATARERLAQVRSRQADVDAESRAIGDERHSLGESIVAAQSHLDAVVSRRAELEDVRGTLEVDRDALRTRLSNAREKAEDDRASVQEIAIKVESRRSSKDSAAAGLERVSSQQEHLVRRRDELTEQLNASIEPIVEEEQRLVERLDDRLSIEERMSASRRAMDAVDSELRDAEQQRVDKQQVVSDSREVLDTTRLEVREVQVRAETVNEQFVQTSFDLEEVFEALPEEASIERWEEDAAGIERRIQRLGAINLAAIDEFKEQAERKEYLDAQHADLTDALETLDAAIRKIDRETRTRFKETFDRANAGIGRLFPRLFGGGHAYLEMEGDDLLSAGVTVMARPPGKRISTIHLMSGGEKALTAVSLVFAIFELNPAPFCLLDEVDAPLDDANVGRFSEIVGEMAQQVQFVLITHNKVTMEAMNQLTGVTMNEPGVSRLVAVDIDEAVQLAAM